MFFFILLYLVLVLVRPQDYPALVDSGIPMLPIVLMIAFVFWLPSRNKHLSPPQYVLLGLFLVVLMLSQIVNGWFGGALIQLESFGPTVLAFTVLAHAAVDLGRVRKTMLVFVLSGVILAIHGIDQVSQGVGWTGVGLSQETRIQYLGIFNDPNDLGLLFIITLPMALFLASRGGWLGLRRLFWWGAAGVLVYGIYLTASRGALLAIVAIAAVWLWQRRGLIMAGMLGAGMLGGLLMLPSRMANIDASESSAAGRVDAWYAGLEMFLANPLFGVGPLQFADNNANLTAHNSFVLVLAETGIIGLTIWLAFVIYGFRMVMAVIKHQPELDGEQAIAEWKTERSLATTLLLSQVGFYSAAFFLSRSYVILLYLLAALVLGYYTGACRRYPGLPRFDLARDILRWPLVAAACTFGLYVIVKLLLVTM
ncbi:O-antigen ligase family protein [Dokdonella sp.]|uniref:O-antigen ligase family protein n=1 Tax=Dokdonella sp. TaxID=2291710 RepID=UPI003C42CEB5